MNKKFIIITLIVIALVAAGFAWKNQKQAMIQKQTAQKVSPQPTIPAGAIATGEGSYAIKTDIPNQMKFVSPKLGISFLYMNPVGSQKIFVKEEGNKVYLYPDYSGTEYTYKDGNYVEVFKKDSKDTLATAIKETLLKNYSEKDCNVKQVDLDGRNIQLFKTGVIGFPNDNYGWTERIFQKAADRCPINYRVTNNGVRYFAMDENHPNKFIFFELRQSSNIAVLDKKKCHKQDCTVGWYSTLEFID